MKRLIDVDVILKATTSTEGDQALLQSMLEFYNHYFPRIGIDLYMEPTFDGMLMFYSTFEDFFSSFYIPNQCSKDAEESCSKRPMVTGGTPVKWHIQAEKLPAGHTFIELMRTAEKFYEKFIPGTRFDILSDREAILAFPNEDAFKRGIHFIETCIGAAKSSPSSN
jgi:hypothetical protein